MFHLELARIHASFIQMEVDRKLREELLLDSQKLRVEFRKLQYGESQSHGVFIPKRFEDLKLNGGSMLRRVPIKLIYHTIRFKKLKSKTPRRTLDLPGSLDLTGLMTSQRRCVRVKAVRMKKKNDCEKKATQFKLAQACMSLGMFLESPSCRDSKDYMKIRLGNRSIIDTGLKQGIHFFRFGSPVHVSGDHANHCAKLMEDQKNLAKDHEERKHSDLFVGMKSLQDDLIREYELEEMNKDKSLVNLYQDPQQRRKRAFHKVWFKVRLHRRSKVAAQNDTKNGDIFKLEKSASLHTGKSTYTRRVMVEWYYYRTRSFVIFVGVMPSKTMAKAQGFGVKERNYKFRKRRLWKGNKFSAIKLESRGHENYAMKLLGLKSMGRKQHGDGNKRSGKRGATLVVCLLSYGMQFRLFSSPEKYTKRFKLMQYKVSQKTSTQVEREMRKCGTGLYTWSHDDDSDAARESLQDETILEPESERTRKYKSQVELSPLQQPKEQQRFHEVRFKGQVETTRKSIELLKNTTWPRSDDNSDISKEKVSASQYTRRTIHLKRVITKRGYHKVRKKKSHCSGSVLRTTVGQRNSKSVGKQEDIDLELSLLGEVTGRDLKQDNKTLASPVTTLPVSALPVSALPVSEKQTSSGIHCVVTDGECDSGGQNCEEMSGVFINLNMQLRHNHHMFLLQLNSQGRFSSDGWGRGVYLNSQMRDVLMNHKVDMATSERLHDLVAWEEPFTSTDYWVQTPPSEVFVTASLNLFLTVMEEIIELCFYDRFQSPRPPELRKTRYWVPLFYISVSVIELIEVHVNDALVITSSNVHQLEDKLVLHWGSIDNSKYFQVKDIRMEIRCFSACAELYMIDGEMRPFGVIWLAGTLALSDYMMIYVTAHAALYHVLELLKQMSLACEAGIMVLISSEEGSEGHPNGTQKE